MTKSRFRFSHRGKLGPGPDRYYWVAARKMAGDSRTEHVDCDVEWFWTGGEVKTEKVPARVAGVQQLRRSGAAGPHNHSRPRTEQERRAIKDQEN